VVLPMDATKKLLPDEPAGRKEADSSA
jgi:hypothetical protein